MNFEEIIAKKIMSLERLMRMVATWRLQEKKIVFTNGCFDLLHRGHLHLLHASRSLGDVLIVGLNSDSSVSKIKPGRPVQNEESRAFVLASLEVVDAVILFTEDTPLNLINEILPDVLVKGGDYMPGEIVGSDAVTKYGGKVEIVPFLKGFSTSEIISKIKSG